MQAFSSHFQFITTNNFRFLDHNLSIRKFCSQNNVVHVKMHRVHVIEKYVHKETQNHKILGIEDRCHCIWILKYQKI